MNQIELLDTIYRLSRNSHVAVDTKGNMHIATDLDDCLYPYIDMYCVFSNERYGTSISRDDLDTYDVGKASGISQDVEKQRLHEFHKSEHFLNMQPIDGVQEIIASLAEHSRIVAITARPVSIRDPTFEHLDRDFPGQIAVAYFSHNSFLDSPGKPKHEYCKEFKFDWIIEDSVRNATECRKYSRVLLYNCPWNKGNFPRMTRFYSWGQVPALLS